METLEITNGVVTKIDLRCCEEDVHPCPPLATPLAVNVDLLLMMMVMMVVICRQSRRVSTWHGWDSFRVIIRTENVK